MKKTLKYRGITKRLLILGGVSAGVAGVLGVVNYLFSGANDVLMSAFEMFFILIPLLFISAGSVYRLGNPSKVVRALVVMALILAGVCFAVCMFMVWGVAEALFCTAGASGSMQCSGPYVYPLYSPGLPITTMVALVAIAGTAQILSVRSRSGVIKILRDVAIVCLLVCGVLFTVLEWAGLNYFVETWVFVCGGVLVFCILSMFVLGKNKKSKTSFKN